MVKESTEPKAQVSGETTIWRGQGCLLSCLGVYIKDFVLIEDVQGKTTQKEGNLLYMKAVELVEHKKNSTNIFYSISCQV